MKNSNQIEIKLNECRSEAPETYVKIYTSPLFKYLEPFLEEIY